MAECIRKKHRSAEEKKNLTKRLNIIEGQVRGVKDMVLEDRYCDEIMIQIAITKSLKSLGTEMLKNHLQTCIVNELKNDNLSAIDDVISLFDKLN